MKPGTIVRLPDGREGTAMNLEFDADKARAVAAFLRAIKEGA